MRLTVGDQQVLFIYATAIIIILLTIIDLLSLLISSFAWPVEMAGIAGLVLMMDTASIVYSGTLLYSLQSGQHISTELEALKRSRYSNAPA